ncbi:MAG TPA: RidA family protein [Zeimonas sp.]|nr:RidA family protein [Zeimonas sp.]
MGWERIVSPEVGEVEDGLWSNCIRAGDFLFVSGQVARSTTAGNTGGEIVGRDEYEQSRYIFERIRHLVEAAGGRMSDVVKLNIYLVDISRNKDVWRARREFFSGDFPTSTLVEVSALARPEIRVEIEAVAYLGRG